MHKSSSNYSHKNGHYSFPPNVCASVCARQRTDKMQQIYNILPILRARTHLYTRLQRKPARATQHITQHAYAHMCGGGGWRRWCANLLLRQCQAKRARTVKTRGPAACAAPSAPSAPSRALRSWRVGVEAKRTRDALAEMQSVMFRAWAAWAAQQRQQQQRAELQLNQRTDRVRRPGNIAHTLTNTNTHTHTHTKRYKKRPCERARVNSLSESAQTMRAKSPLIPNYYARPGRLVGRSVGRRCAIGKCQLTKSTHHL